MSEAIVRPGDKLIITFKDALHPSQAEDVIARAEERLPGVDVVLIDSCSDVFVYRTSED
jgi:hypothetical protein